MSIIAGTLLAAKKFNEETIKVNIRVALENKKIYNVLFFNEYNKTMNREIRGNSTHITYLIHLYLQSLRFIQNCDAKYL